MMLLGDPQPGPGELRTEDFCYLPGKITLDSGSFNDCLCIARQYFSQSNYLFTHLVKDRGNPLSSLSTIEMVLRLIDSDL